MKTRLLFLSIMLTITLFCNGQTFFTTAYLGYAGGDGTKPDLLYEVGFGKNLSRRAAVSISYTLSSSDRNYMGSDDEQTAFLQSIWIDSKNKNKTPATQFHQFRIYAAQIQYGINQLMKNEINIGLGLSYAHMNSLNLIGYGPNPIDLQYEHVNSKGLGLNASIGYKHYILTKYFLQFSAFVNGPLYGGKIGIGIDL